MKWPGVVVLLALGAGCSFPSYLIQADGKGSGASASGGASGMAGAGALAGTESTGGSQGGSTNVAGAGAGATAGAGGSGGMAAGLAPVGAPGQWQLTFEDDFEGKDLEASRWITFMREGDSEFRVWGSRDEYIADENVRLEDGVCVLTAQDEDREGKSFTSGAINTAGLFEQEFGFFEARIKLPLGNGFWGVWALRSLAGWPPAITGVEVLGGQPARANFSYWWQGGAGAEQVRYEATNDYTGGYHVYGIDWQPTQVAFYVDGALLETLDAPEGRLSGPLYPSVNLSISTADSGDPVPDDTTPWPGELRIDWVRVYLKLP